MRSKLQDWAYQIDSLIDHEVRDGNRSSIFRKTHSYNPKVKVSHWEYKLASLPYDNVTHDQKFSVYDRLGTSNEPTPISETKDALLKGIQKETRYSKARHRPMINIITYPTTLYIKIPPKAVASLAGSTNSDATQEPMRFKAPNLFFRGERRREMSLLTNFNYQHPNINKTDYKTTMYRDYQCPRPLKTKFISNVECRKVETKHRKLSIFPVWDMIRPGYNKFMDENLEKYIKCTSTTPPPYSLDYPPEETWKRLK